MCIFHGHFMIASKACFPKMSQEVCTRWMSEILLTAIAWLACSCRWKKPMKAAAFKQWVDLAQWQIEMRGRLQKALRRMQHLKLAAAFTAWAQHTTDVKACEAQTTIEKVQVHHLIMLWQPLQLGA
jgi:hypothetical protein